jgi:L-ascorbate metabolism protein UlaG (beta-lactamase superfamily)
MTSIYDCSFTKTFNAVVQAATTGNKLYVNNEDGSLYCSHWLPAAFTRNITVADITTVISKLDEAFSLTEQMLSIHSNRTKDEEINKWVLAAQRTQQLFEAAGSRPTSHALINEIAAQHKFRFLLPDTIKGSSIGLAQVASPPHAIAQARGPNIVKGKFFYGEPFSFFTGLVQMAQMSFYTQLERIMSAAIKVIQAVGSIFGCTFTSLNRFHYFRNNETKSDIYDTDNRAMPLDPADSKRFSSYWIGHATHLFSVPVQDTKGHHSRINIITDPIEGDLNPLLYPRMTDPARPIEQCPPIHVCILSHNHTDHTSPETLHKLLPFNPLMAVPKGDGEYIRSLGFTRVVELGWFEHAGIQMQDLEGNTYELGICGVPANHGSGNLQQPTRTSLFNGYVLQSDALDGDIYFAGDTARLDAEHIKTLRETFSIKYNFQPGGPDEVRSLNEDSHQASCDGIALHLHLIVSRLYQQFVTRSHTLPTFEQLRALCAQTSTQYFHTKTYKLGNLHFDDTDASVNRVLEWLKTHDSWVDLATAANLKPYEKNVLLEIAQDEGTHLLVADSKSPLFPKQIALLLEKNIIVPKIGSCFLSPFPN